METVKREMTKFSVTEKDVKEAIVQEIYVRAGFKTVICVLILDDGFEVVGTSAPVDVDNMDLSIGKDIAKQNALDNVWGHLGSIMQRHLAIHRAEETRAKMKAEAELQPENPPESGMEIVKD